MKSFEIYIQYFFDPTSTTSACSMIFFKMWRTYILYIVMLGCHAEFWWLLKNGFIQFPPLTFIKCVFSSNVTDTVKRNDLEICSDPFIQRWYCIKKPSLIKNELQFWKLILFNFDFWNVSIFTVRKHKGIIRIKFCKLYKNKDIFFRIDQIKLNRALSALHDDWRITSF